jgi:uroporphyrinogen decarboxylase
MMKPRERIQAVLKRQTPDRVPRFEIWIDALLDELGLPDVPTAHVRLGQDSIMMPTHTPVGSNAWKNGVDEWGRSWKEGMYVTGVLDRVEDLQKYSPPISYAAGFFNEETIKTARLSFPDHMLMYGSHLGPFMGAYMAMGFERFFLRLLDNPGQVHEILENRTEWAIAMYRHAIRLGAEILVMGEDAAHKQAPMISPKMWREFVYPYHRRIVESLDRPIIFHSDGNILPMLPQVIEAGFMGYHSLEPAAGIDLAGVKREYGKDLILIGNVDVRILAGDNLSAVRQEVDRCIAAGSPGGGYMISTCNSIFKGLNPEAVAEMFKYEQELEKSNQGDIYAKLR